MRAGVSRATVSRVLNVRTEALVAEPTRARVLMVAREMGYHPNAVARGLAGKPMNTLGVVLAYILPSVTADPFLGPVLDGILDIDKRRRQKTVIFTEDDWEEALGNLPMYCDGHCDGLIVVIPRSDSSFVSAVGASSLPFVVIGDYRPDPDVTVVDADNVAAAESVVRYLLDAGHRRIAVLCGNADLSSNGQRQEGYRRAHAAFGVEVDEELIVPGQYWEYSGRENTDLLMRLPEERRPTALFCANGRIGLGAVQALEGLGMRIPEDISLTAICESADIATARFPLTAAQMPLRRIGERAAELLLAQIHEGVPAGKKVLLPAELVERASVGPPRPR
jgi:LacI family transcriptional regulator